MELTPVKQRLMAALDILFNHPQIMEKLPATMVPLMRTFQPLFMASLAKQTDEEIMDSFALAQQFLNAVIYGPAPQPLHPDPPQLPAAQNDD
jgi:hypothetical protein